MKFYNLAKHNINKSTNKTQLFNYFFHLENAAYVLRGYVKAILRNFYKNQN